MMVQLRSTSAISLAFDFAALRDCCQWPKEMAQHQREDIERVVLERNNLVYPLGAIEDGKSRYAFVHRLFVKYLAACELVARDHRGEGDGLAAELGRELLADPGTWGDWRDWAECFGEPANAEPAGLGGVTAVGLFPAEPPPWPAAPGLAPGPERPAPATWPATSGSGRGPAGAPRSIRRPLRIRRRPTNGMIRSAPICASRAAAPGITRPVAAGPRSGAGASRSTGTASRVFAWCESPWLEFCFLLSVFWSSVFCACLSGRRCPSATATCSAASPPSRPSGTPTGPPPAASVSAPRWRGSNSTSRRVAGASSRILAFASGALAAPFLGVCQSGSVPSLRTARKRS